MGELQKERDNLAKEKTALLQKLAAVTQASAEERKRLEQTYKDKLTSVERRLKELAEREKHAKRSAAQLVSKFALPGRLCGTFMAPLPVSFNMLMCYRATVTGSRGVRVPSAAS